MPSPSGAMSARYVIDQAAVQFLQTPRSEMACAAHHHQQVDIRVQACAVLQRAAVDIDFPDQTAHFLRHDPRQRVSETAVRRVLSVAQGLLQFVHASRSLSQLTIASAWSIIRAA